MKVVCDTSFFFISFPLEGDLYTTPQVIDELCDLRSKCRFDTLKEDGLIVTEADPASRKLVLKAAESSGDLGVLSETDISIIAVAYSIKGEIATDDFAIQNVAATLGIGIIPILQRRAKKRVWKLVCTGCGRDVEGGIDCPVCGASLKRRHK
jgi:UPF0271 protein